MPVKKAPSDRRKPAKKAAARTTNSGRTTEPAPITTGAEWGREARDKRVKGRPVTVPTGKTCLVKMLDSMQEFLARGDVPNAMLPMMQEAATGKVKDEKQVTDLVMSDPGKLKDMFDLVDMIVIECVLEPPVAPIPQNDEGKVIPPHLRDDDDTLYVDYIDLGDKMFIFNYALSGVSDLEQFRAGSGQGVVPLRAVEELDESAKRHPAARE
jgi:hypothetical protein